VEWIGLDRERYEEGEISQGIFGFPTMRNCYIVHCIIFGTRCEDWDDDLMLW
jgi:hypothetical protein